MQGLFSDQRLHDAQIVRAFRNVRKQVADHQTAITTFLKLPWTAHPDASGITLRQLRNSTVSDLLSLMFRQRWLVIERVNMTRASVHKAEDHVLCPGRVMSRQRAIWCRRLRVARHEPGQSQQAKSVRGVSEKLPPIRRGGSESRALIQVRHVCSQNPGRLQVTQEGVRNKFPNCGT